MTKVIFPPTKKNKSDSQFNRPSMMSSIKNFGSKWYNKLECLVCNANKTNNHSKYKDPLEIMHTVVTWTPRMRVKRGEFVRYGAGVHVAKCNSCGIVPGTDNLKWLFLGHRDTVSIYQGEFGIGEELRSSIGKDDITKNKRKLRQEFYNVKEDLIVPYPIGIYDSLTHELCVALRKAEIKKRRLISKNSRTI
jgi:hypothetical protein